MSLRDFLPSLKRDTRYDSEVLEAEQVDKAEKILAAPELILKHLEEKFPDTIPPTELSLWDYGVLKGRQDVMKELRHQINTASK